VCHVLQAVEVVLCTGGAGVHALRAALYVGSRGGCVLYAGDRGGCARFAGGARDNALHASLYVGGCGGCWSCWK